MSGSEELVAWLVYLAAAVGCSAVWWRITAAAMRTGAWRDLARGIVVVLIFTPWFTGGANESLAPAVVVLLMDLLLEGAAGGMRGGLVLLASTLVMILFLMVRAVLRRRIEASARTPPPSK